MNEMHQLQDSSRPTEASVKGSASEYLAFVLGAEHYVIDIRPVQEMRGYSHVTHIANAPEHIKGVVNLRGMVVPVLDRRIRFGNQRPIYNDQTIVFVLTVLGRVSGVVVDAVSDVVEAHHAAAAAVWRSSVDGAHRWYRFTGGAHADCARHRGALSYGGAWLLDLAAPANLC